jgi:hypothetical protein
MVLFTCRFGRSEIASSLRSFDEVCPRNKLRSALRGGPAPTLPAATFISGKTNWLLEDAGLERLTKGVEPE